MSMIPLLAALFAGLLLASPPRAQEKEAHEAELRALVAPLASESGPGGILAVLRLGVPTFTAIFGLADIEQHAPVRADTPFYVASVAKTFTAACVLAAAESGKLDLEASIRKPLPVLPPSFEAVTPRQLLHHRGGVRDVYELAIALDLGPGPLASNAAALELIAKAGGPDATPGALFRYSNSGYVLLAEALRAATGESLPASARRLVFEPLGMKTARFSGEPAREGSAQPRAARGYGSRGEAWVPIENPSGLLGPGGLWLSLDDLARWERAAFEGGWGTPRTRAELVAAPRLTREQSEHPAFGAYAGGAMVGTDRGLPVVRTAGQAFGFAAEILRYPEQELSVVMLTNADLGTSELAERAAGLVLGEEFAAAREAAAPPAAGVDLARFGRFWVDEASGVLWILSARAGSLVAASLDGWKFEMVAAGPARLVAREARLPFELDLEPEVGSARTLTARADGKLVARCRPLVPARVDPAEFEGEYEFAPLGVVLRLRAQGGGLAIVQEHALFPDPPYVLPPFQPLGEDFFACDAGAQMHFTRDAEGTVVGLQLDLNRARGLVLEKR